MSFDYLLMRHLVKDAYLKTFAIAKDLKLKQQRMAPHELLKGRTIALVADPGLESARIVWEISLKQLGATVCQFSLPSGHAPHTNIPEEMARSIDSYCDAAVAVFPEHESISDLAKRCDVPVINGYSGSYDPCQVLTDIYTAIERTKIPPEQLRVAWVGPAMPGTDAWVEAAAILGFTLQIACPKGFGPNQTTLDWALSQSGRCIVTDSLSTALAGSNVIITDAWYEHVRKRLPESAQKYCSFFLLTSAIMQKAKKGSFILHANPLQRGLEIADDLYNGQSWAAWDSMANRLHVQKALLLRLLS